MRELLEGCKPRPCSYSFIRPFAMQPAAPPRHTPVGTDPGAHRAAVTGRKPRARKGDALKKCPTARLQKLLAAAS